MIHGFEDQTHELTDYERKELLPLFINGLGNKIGSKKAITNKQMISALRQRRDSRDQPIKITDSRVRKLINHIRTNGLIEGLIANSKGYYITNDPVELQKYLDSLQARANEIERVKESLKPYMRKLMQAS